MHFWYGFFRHCHYRYLFIQVALIYCASCKSLIIYVFFFLYRKLKKGRSTRNFPLVENRPVVVPYPQIQYKTHFETKFFKISLYLLLPQSRREATKHNDANNDVVFRNPDAWKNYF